jgi:hypothetical protein
MRNSGIVRLIAVIAVGLTVGCRRAVDSPTAASNPQKTHVIPFTIDPSSGLLVVTATVDLNPQHPQVKRLVIDTGSPRTCFFASEQAVTAWAKVVPAAKLDEWQGSGGQGVEVCRFDTAVITLGGCCAKMPIYASSYNMDVKPDYDGLLGMDFLSRYKITIDYRAHTVTLTLR